MSCQYLENFLLANSNGGTENLTDDEPSKDQTNGLPKPASLTNASGHLAKAWVRHRQKVEIFLEIYFFLK